MRKRAPVKRRLTEIARHVFADPVEVLPAEFMGLEQFADATELQFVVRYTWDAGVVNVPTVFLGVTEGPNEPAGMKRQDSRTDDTFTISGYIAVPVFATHDDGAMAAEQAAESALNLLDEAIGQTHGLVDAAIESAMAPSEYVLSKVSVSYVDGPYHGFPDAQAASISGGVTFTVSCTAVLT